MHMACLIGEKNVVLKLMKVNKVNKKDMHGATPLHYAIMKNNIDVVNALLRADADMYARGPEGNYAIHFAASLASCKITEILGYCGCNINLKNKHGERPLHIAAGKGYSKQLNSLLAISSKALNSTDNEGKTPLYHAVEADSLSV